MSEKLEELISLLYQDKLTQYGKRLLVENIEKLQKENKELKANCIPIQKVKDKIEELKKKVEELTDDKGYWGGSDLLEQIKVLQELLESEERK